MIYSRWKPTTGGYDYFKANETDVPLGNDLPVPKISGGTKIGVASVDIGRPIPAGAARMGSGPLAIGLIAPTRKAGALSGLGDLVTSTIPAAYLWLSAGLLGGWAIRRAKRGK